MALWTFYTAEGNVSAFVISNAYSDSSWNMNIIGISGLHNSVSFKKKEFPWLTSRQYRIAQGFDSAAALVSKRRIEAVAAEERFTRVKSAMLSEFSDQTSHCSSPSYGNFDPSCAGKSMQGLSFSGAR